MALGRKTGGRTRGTPNRRTIGLRLARQALAAGGSAAPFDALAQLRAIAQYFLDQADAERRKAKPCARTINDSYEQAARVLREITPYERPRLTSMKVGGSLNLAELTDSELASLRRLLLKMGASDPAETSEGTRAG
jgi:hypothetical protein